MDTEKYGFDFVKKAASATAEENREGKQHERGRNEGKGNVTNDVGTMGGWGEAIQNNPTRGRKPLSNRGLTLNPKP